MPDEHDDSKRQPDRKNSHLIRDLINQQREQEQRRRDYEQWQKEQHQAGTEDDDYYEPPKPEPSVVTVQPTIDPVQLLKRKEEDERRRETIRRLEEQKYSTSSDNIWKLFTVTLPHANKMKIILWLVGVLLFPVTLAGALLGYVRAYLIFLFPHKKFPTLSNPVPIVKRAMIIGAFLIYGAVAIAAFLLFLVLEFLYNNVEIFRRSPGIIWGYFVFSISVTGIIFWRFKQWQASYSKMLSEEMKFGTARFARQDELMPYTLSKGFYIGGAYRYEEKGHLLTVAGTRGGKMASILAPNLLGMADFDGSWVIVDPKAELGAITARYQREQNRNVVIINPWGVLDQAIGEAMSYNPLDILTDADSLHLVDDIMIISEMIVPISNDEKDKFFSDNARSIIAGLITHLMTARPKEEQTLGTLWEWIRYDETRFDALLIEMSKNNHPVNGKIARAAANVILKLMAAGEDTYGSILATVLQCTDFLQSPALQKSLEHGFDPKTLSQGNTTMYVVIPADKLQSHSRWLRLVVMTAMRAVVRNPGERVCFLLDEFASLGYLSEAETALSTYAGYNITLWCVLQSLVQLKNIYGDNYESFIGNSAVRHFFSVNDLFTAEYISNSVGATTNMQYQKRWYGISQVESNQRALITPDELRRESGKNIFTFIDAHPPTYYPKRHYYDMPELIDNGVPRYDPNPYYTGIK